MQSKKVVTATPGEPPQLERYYPYYTEGVGFSQCKVKAIGINNRDEVTDDDVMWNVTVRFKRDGKVVEEVHCYRQDPGVVTGDPQSPPWPNEGFDDSANESLDPNVDNDL